MNLREKRKLGLCMNSWCDGINATPPDDNPSAFKIICDKCQLDRKLVNAFLLNLEGYDWDLDEQHAIEAIYIVIKKNLDAILERINHVD